MTEQSNDSKVSAVRTFADDLKKVRGISNASSPQPNIKKIDPAVVPNQTAETVSAAQINTPQPPAKPVLPKAASKNVSAYLTHEETQTETNDVPETTPVTTTPSNPQPTVLPETKIIESEKITIPDQVIAGELSQVATLAGKQVLSGAGEFTEDELENSGTIIQDKKIEHHHLVPSIAKATKNWVVEKKAAYEESQRPEFTVTKAEARLETIKKAMESSKRAPEDDFADVAKKIKSVEHEVIDESVIIKDKVEAPKPQWGYAAAAGETLAEAEQEQKSKELVPVWSNEYQANNDPNERDDSIDEEDNATDPKKWHLEQDDPALSFLANEDEVLDEDKTLIAERLKAEVAAKVRLQNGEPEPEPEPEPVEFKTDNDLTGSPLRQVVVGENVQAAADTYQPPKEATEPAPQPTPSNTAVIPATEKSSGSPLIKITIYILIVLLAMGLIGGLVVSLFWLFNNFNQNDSVSKVDTATPTVQNATPVNYSSNRQTILNNIRTAQNTTGEQSTITFIDSNQNLVASEIALSTIIESGNGLSILRQAKEVEFGSTAQNEPYIKIVGTSYDALLAGMLAWESNINQDLYPLFGYNDFNDTNFTDLNTPYLLARVLYEGTEDRLVYTFTSRNTIVISGDRNVPKHISE